jgi:ribulose-phosphate 3-epimerase
LIRYPRVIPTVLADSPEVLKDIMQKVETYTDYAQIDIMDGEFVPTRSITAEDIKKLNSRLGWEAHMMVKQPEKHFHEFKNAGTKKVIFHFEATDKPVEVINTAREMGLSVGIAINPDTRIPEYESLVTKVDGILFMTVYPGYYGAKFVPSVLNNIRELRGMYPDIEISTDGSVNSDTIEQIIQSGVDVVYVGSAILKSPDPRAQYRKFQAMAEQAAKKRKPE